MSGGYRVVSRFLDVPTGRYVEPDALWSPADAAQAARLVKAKCVVPVTSPPPRGAVAPPAPSALPVAPAAPAELKPTKKGRGRGAVAPPAPAGG